jgi:mannose-6-phosphate isomerase-like protein (cupin superfamily)
LAEVGRNEGVFVPHGTHCWFESVDDEPLEILRVSTINTRPIS